MNENGAPGRVVYLNGKLVAEKDARISIYDSALMFGDMVFEMTRSFNKRQFRLREHLQRLSASMRLAHISEPMSIDDLEQKCYEVIDANEPAFEDHDEHRLVINVSRGPLAIYRDVFDGRLEPTVVIADFPLKWTVAAMGKLLRLGINVVIPSQRAIPAQLLDPKVKSRSRMHYMIANVEVSHWPGDNNWALLVDPDGFIAEGTGDNFFMVKDGQLITPEPRNILRGISRDYVMELATQIGMPNFEQNIEPYDVMTADEAFVTGTPFCMLPVTHINTVAIGDGKRGPIFDRLLRTWSENVGLDIESQLLAYGQEVAELRQGVTPYSFRP